MGQRNALLVEALQAADADILILTETNESLNFGEGYNRFCTNTLKDRYYKEGEKRTIIYSRYPAKRRCETFNGDTSICIESETPNGNLIIYGTVVGSHGNRKSSFNEDINQHLSDFERISREGDICISGNFNISFCDNYYDAQYGKTKLASAFDHLHLINLTADIPGNINHIVMSKYFMANKIFNINTWNEDKKLSDHTGVMVTLIG